MQQQQYQLLMQHHLNNLYKLHVFFFIVLLDQLVIFACKHMTTTYNAEESAPQELSVVQVSIVKEQQQTDKKADVPDIIFL